MVGRERLAVTTSCEYSSSLVQCGKFLDCDTLTVSLPRASSLKLHESSFSTHYF
jgi:hypothetical protein